MKKPVVLVVMDGVGETPEELGNMVKKATTPTLNELKETCPWQIIKAHGTAVGLPSDDDMGNSEVGHNALGCGQIYSQGAKLVNESIESGKIYTSDAWKNLVSDLKDNGATLHFIGLLSDGNVHSNISHLIAMLKEAKKEGVKRVRCHILLDGRDVPATSALEYVQELEDVLASLNDADFDGKIASGGGRMTITMDRYQANWPMVKAGWDTHVHGIGRQFATAKEAIETFRAETGVIDQDLPAFVIAENGKPVGKMEDGDSVILFNFRGDRAQEISMAFDGDSSFDKFDRGDYTGVNFAGMLEYDGDLKVKNYGALLKAHASVFDTTKKCPKEYRSSRDLYLEKSAEVVITLLGSNTCWNSSMGYYYYKTGNKPKSLADANVVMIFPNTQDGRWSNSPWESRLYQGVERGTAVQLIYYPEIADGSKAGATTVFPADYRIGFVLATNAWTNRLRAGDKKYRAATSDGLSVNNNGVAYQTPRTAVFRYTDKKSGINSVLFSFEDHTNDENFSDVVFTMTSNPVDAVTDIPSVDVNDGKKTANVLRGIYAFEDLWPSRGDYDMNDVMVRSDYEKVFNEKGVFEESFMLKTFANFAGNANGLAVTLTGAAADAKLEFSVRKRISSATARSCC